MLRRTNTNRWGFAPSVYPFRKPFYDTPYDQDRHNNHFNSQRRRHQAYPAWMDHGVDGSGRAVGLYRAHPLSKYYGTLKDNLQRENEHVPRVFRAIAQGYAHFSGRTLYSNGAKLPQPQMHPYLTGEPCPVYGWRILDHNNVTRTFDAPQVPLDKVRYKPYVALHERRIVGENEIPATPASDDSSTEGKKIVPKDDSSKGGKKGSSESKPLLKRLFFWQ
jgi:hypothetical protein